MGTLYVYLFGGMRTKLDNISEIKMSPVIKSLFAYLLLHRHQAHSREALASLFWQNYDERSAKRCLNTALWRLRQDLNVGELKSDQFILTEGSSKLRFNPDSPFWLDLADFETTAKLISDIPPDSCKQEDIASLEKVVQMYNRELLTGFYQDWALRERERMRKIYLNALRFLMKYYRTNNYLEDSIRWGQKVLDLDPLREEIHRDMMRLYYKIGRKNRALKQYEGYCQTLAAELKTSPMKETQKLYHEIASGIGLPKKSPELSHFEEAFHHLQAAMNELEKVKTQLLHFKRGL